MAIVNQNPTSGSVGNVTNSRGRSGQIQRRRSIPTNPNSTAQSAARARLTSVSAGWRGLADYIHQTWTAFANSFTVTNALGMSFHLTGQQAYLKVNTVNDLNGDVIVTEPPPLPTFQPLTITELQATVTGSAVKLLGTSPATPTLYMFYAAPQRSAGVQFENDFRFLDTRDAVVGNNFNLDSVYQVKFGLLTAGKKIFVKVVQSQKGMQDNGTVFSTRVI